MSRRSRIACCSVAGLATAGLTLSPTASAVSPDVVVSEVYGGGGNSGATLTNDFVELRNDGSTPVSVDGWSVQYASASGSSWSVTPLSGTIQPGTDYLVQEGAGSGGTVSLPTPDATGSSNLSGSSGKVALVTASTSLGCGATCHADPSVKDYVGYGTATDYEGASAAPGLSNETSDARSGADTDQNGTDFAAGSPTPTNSAGETSGSGGSGGVDGLQIHDIQGAAQVSPHVGQTANNVPGVVTAVKSSGFWMQDTTPDSNDATSEGIFVFTGTAPSASPGQTVTVTGKVAEYHADSAGLGTTELDNPTVTVTGTAALPTPVTVGPGGRTPPGSVIENDSASNVETGNAFDPDQDGIDFWESMEGMRVEIDDAQVVGPTNGFGEIPVVPVGSGTRTPRGGILFQRNDPNPERVIVGPDLLGSLGLPTANVGDSLPDLTGVLGYAFDNFRLMPSTAPDLVAGGIQREITAAATPKQLSVGTFNVENLDPTDPGTKFDGLAVEIVHNLRSPDILALEEVQDNDGAKNDGVVAADQTLNELTTAIRNAGGPSYDWRQIDPVNDAEGGEPGGNIRVAFLYRSVPGLTFVDHGTPSSTVGTAVTGSGKKTSLTISPGRIDPGSSAWADSRVPLVGQFSWQGRSLFVVANHFRSKGGDDPLFGKYQPGEFPSEPQRHQQAGEVRGFVDDLLSADPKAQVAVVGDLNDYEFSQTADILVGSGDTALTDLPRTLPADERYTYDYEGNSEVLDHIMLSPQLVKGGYAYDVVHVNAEFADQLSDHDPQVVRLGR